MAKAPATNEDRLLRETTRFVTRHAQLTESIAERPIDELFTRLALSASKPVLADSVGSELRFLSSAEHLPRGRKLTKLGKSIFLRWSLVLHEFVCNPKSSDRALQARLVGALSGRSGGVTALIAVLVSYFALPAGVAVIIATLLVKLIVEPAGEEICSAWKKTLPTKGVRPRKRRRPST